MEQDHKVALVTGASRGIGAAIAARLVQDGFSVVINYKNNSESAVALVRSINQAGGRAVAIGADVANSGEVAEMISEAIERFGRIDVLVNNAGVVRDGLVQNMTEENWDKVINTNLKGVFICSKAVLKVMRRQHGGRIINIASIVGQQGRRGQANYAAAKAGIIGFSKSVAREVASRNITANAVAPGFIQTRMTDVLPDNIKTKLKEQIPMGRLGLPEDIANTVVFLASDAASYITGQTIAVDGGMVMQ